MCVKTKIIAAEQSVSEELKISKNERIDERAKERFNVMRDRVTKKKGGLQFRY